MAKNNETTTEMTSSTATGKGMTTAQARKAYKDAFGEAAPKHIVDPTTLMAAVNTGAKLQPKGTDVTSSPTEDVDTQVTTTESVPPVTGKKPINKTSDTQLADCWAAIVSGDATHLPVYRQVKATLWATGGKDPSGSTWNNATMLAFLKKANKGERNWTAVHQHTGGTKVKVPGAKPSKDAVSAFKAHIASLSTEAALAVLDALRQDVLSRTAE